MGDACATCGRPRATRDTPLHSHKVCWAAAATRLLPAMNCDGRAVSAMEARALAAEKRAEAAEAERDALRAELATARELVAVLEERAEALSAQATDLFDTAKALDGRRREARMLLTRMVKYCREDKATTARATRLERLVEQVADYLNRTHDPADILRGDDGKAGGA